MEQRLAFFSELRLPSLAEPTPQSKKEALGKVTFVWEDGGKVGVLDCFFFGGGALIFLAIPCAVSSWLACSSSSWPALRPRAPDTTIKKGSPREGYFCVLGCGGWGVGARGEGRCFFLRFPVPLFLACAFFFFLVRASPPARKGRSFLFSCELWVYPAWRPPSAVPCPLGQKCLEHLSSAQAHRGADRQPPSWRCCCSWLLLGVSAEAP